MCKFFSVRSVAMVLLLASGISKAVAGYSVSVSPPAAPQTKGYRMGSATSPDGSILTFDSCSFLLNGHRWTPVMAEFHYSRLPDSEWREELLKIKAGGIDIVATYVFWIHHEEIENQWDWAGCRNLRKFVQLCGEVGLKVMVRCGPWDHGEVRNGGHPDWLLKKGWKLRSDDPPYIEKTKLLYGQIAQQLRGLLWKDGGPVIGIQFENEYTGPATHLLNLKKLGYEAGLDVPLYTRTGWNSPSGIMPFGEVIPLYGVYAEGFWDRSIEPMPAGYWKAFIFSTNRVDDAELVGAPGLGGKIDPPDAALYPYLTCEIGGGMMNSYHRRILNFPQDSEALTLVRIGDGSVMPGYYMYHGGENPDGKVSTLQESQATGMWNDLPVKNYDFEAPLGQYNQIRPHYHRLRRLHLFLHDWGESLAGMGVTLPAQLPTAKGDTNTLRWCIRSDGQRGFVFVNNYERLRAMPAKPDVQFTVDLPSGAATFPVNPVTIPADACFFWPFNFDLGLGVSLRSATAQPICAVENDSIRTVFFAQTKGVPTEFAFDKSVSLKCESAKVTESGGQRILSGVKPGTRAAMEIKAKEGTLQIVLLSDEASLALWKGSWQGRERVFITRAGLVLDGNNLRLTAVDRDDLKVGVFPAPGEVACNGEILRAKLDGVFQRFAPPKPKEVSLKPAWELLRAAGPPRDIPLGKIEQPVAAAPEDTDFKKAAVWKLKLPEKVALGVDPILRLNYIGDVARVTLNGKLLTDDFYNGSTFDVGLRRYAPDILSGELQVAILPLRRDAPIYLAQSAKPDFGKVDSLAELRGATLIPRYTLQLTVAPVSAGSSAGKEPTSQVHTFRYTNPITRDPSQSMRDQIVLKEGNRWYMTGTSQPIWDGPNPGVRLMVSDDLLHWRDAAWLIDASKLPDDCPYKGRFYAPEIRKINGKFYLVVNSGHFPKKGEYWEANHKAWIFSSDAIAGPYSLITPKGLAVGDYANDASLFGDDDGRTYLYCCTYTGDNKGLHQAEINLKTGKLVDETKGINGFTKVMGPRDQGAPDWMAAGIEGPYVIKRYGFYWMFFSSYTRGYEIGVLKASSPLGPWELAGREPILGTRKHEVRDPLAKSEGYDFVKYEDTKDPYVEVGHNGIFEGPDGKDWICCLYWLRGEKVIANPHVPIYNNTSEQLGIEPLLFENGVFKVNGPTWTEQVVTWEK